LRREIYGIHHLVSTHKQQYLKAGLIDDLQLHIAPVIVGRGLRLFDMNGDVLSK